MFQINLPPFSIKIKECDGKDFVYDPLRKRYVALTPEEWVRQHFTHYLITEKHYPQALMANEVSITFNGMWRRCDTVLYSRTLSPRVIVEYKAPSVPITNEVFGQISRYNEVLRADYLMVSNGIRHYCLKMDYTTGHASFLQQIPSFEEL